MKILEFVIVAIFIFLFGFGFYFIFGYLPGETEYFREYSYNFSDGNESGGQFYPNMRFRDRKISYEIEESCSNSKIREIRTALDIIEKKTVLSFYQDNSGEISFLCSSIAPTPEQKNHFVAGEGGPTEILNINRYSLIFSSKVSLFRTGNCEEPLIALHEIFHALGFDHNTNKRSIMYPITDCEQEIDDYLIESINMLYREDSLPDLTIEKLAAEKSGGRLSFNITISNMGLRDASDSELVVLGDDIEIKRFELGRLEIGAKKILGVQNLRSARDLRKLSFYVKQKNGSELDESNNLANLFIE